MADKVTMSPNELMTQINNYNFEASISEEKNYDPSSMSEDMHNLIYGITEGDMVYDFKRIRRLDHKLLSLSSIIDSLMSLVMSKEFMVPNDEDATLKVQSFLNSYNITNTTNRTMLINGFRHALIYGRVGFRFLSPKQFGGVVMVPANQYMVVYEESKEFKGAYDVIGYVMSRKREGAALPPFGHLRSDGTLMDGIGITPISDIDLNFSIDFINDAGYNDQYVFLKPEQFHNFYFFGDEFHIDTPLNHDIDRIELFSNLIEAINTTICTTTDEVVLVKIAEAVQGLGNLQISDIVTSSKVGQDLQRDKIENNLASFARVLSKGTNRKALVLPPTVDTVSQIKPPVTIDQFIELYKLSEDFIAKLYGLSSNILNLSKLPRDVSSSPIFEQMSRMSVYPKRAIINEFMSLFLAPKLGVDSIVFAPESYNASQFTTQAQNMANVLVALKNADINLDFDTVVGAILDKLNEK